MKELFRFLFAAVFIASASSIVFSADQSVPAGGAPSAADAAMAEAIKLAAPGEGHTFLEPLAGSWTNSVRMWMKSGEKPQESSGSNVNLWTLGQRFLKQEYKSQWNGQPFQGIGYIGFNNLAGVYESVWLDNMTTGMMNGIGSYDRGTKTLKIEGNFACPLTGEKQKWYRSEWQIVDYDKNIYRSYFKDANGKEFESMEIIYKRVK